MTILERAIEKLTREDLIHMIKELDTEIIDLTVANESWKKENQKNHDIMDDLKADLKNSEGIRNSLREKLISIRDGKLGRIGNLLNQRAESLSDTEIVDQTFDIVNSEFDANANNQLIDELNREL